MSPSMACATAPDLFEVDHNSTENQLAAALWVCDTRCTAFTWCQAQPPVPGKVMAGHIIDKKGRAYTNPVRYLRAGQAGREVRTDNCLTCDTPFAVNVNPDRLYCSDPCQRQGRRDRQAEQNDTPGRRCLGCHVAFGPEVHINRRFCREKCRTVHRARSNEYKTSAP